MREVQLHHTIPNLRLSISLDIITLLETKGQQASALVRQSSEVRVQHEPIAQTRQEPEAQSQQPSEQQVPAKKDDYYLLWVENKSMFVVSESTETFSSIKFENNKQYIDLAVKGVQQKCRILMKGKHELQNRRRTSRKGNFRYKKAM